LTDTEQQAWRRLAAVTEAGRFHRSWRRSGVAGIAAALLQEMAA